MTRWTVASIDVPAANAIAFGASQAVNFSRYPSSMEAERTMKTNRLTILGLTFALVIAGVRPSDACSCVDDGPAVMYGGADAVFRGSPISYVEIEESGIPFYVYLIQVTECWKGNVGATVELRALVGDAFCGVFIPPGSEELIYAYNESGHLTTNLCAVSPGNVTEHLEWLGESTCFISVDEVSWGSVKALYR